VAEVGDLVVAGGDGTIGRVLRAAAGTGRTVGLLPLGTFDNFTRSLGIPEDLEAAIQVVKTGRPRPITLGRVAGRPFLEVAAIGVFGELMALGEAAKELAFGELRHHLVELSGAASFRYRLTGDLERTGEADSLVLSNTPTTGAHVVVGDATPDDPYLELALDLTTGRGGLARIAAAILGRPTPPASQAYLRFRHVTVSTDPVVPVCADALEIGRTPVTIEAMPNAVTVIEPLGKSNPGEK
jgi:diacylglycerol kinase family enzyme